MSTTSIASTSLSGSADSAAAALTASAPAGSSSTGTASTAASGSSSLGSLASNFNEFLSLLTTQLQNQDPTAPMDSSQFTTELVQFTGVQAQETGNASLGTLISMQADSQVLQSSAVVGKTATISSNEIALQSGSGTLSFTGTAGETIGVAVVNASGAAIKNATISAQAGSNSWTWDGTDNNGNSVPDGGYRVAVETQASSTSTPTAVPFSVLGTVTGISTSGSATMLDMGQLQVPLSELQSVGS